MINGVRRLEVSSIALPDIANWTSLAMGYLSGLLARVVCNPLLLERWGIKLKFTCSIPGFDIIHSVGFNNEILS